MYYDETTQINTVILPVVDNRVILYYIINYNIIIYSIIFYLHIHIYYISPNKTKKTSEKPQLILAQTSSELPPFQGT